MPSSGRRGGVAALALLAAAVVAGGAPPARAETRPPYGGSIDAALLGAPATLDPVAARTHAEISLVGLLFDGLYRFDAGVGVVPQLAAAPPVIDEARGVVVIALRGGASFHDGTVVDAVAVAASLERLRGSAMGWILAGVTRIAASADAVELSGAGDPVALAQRLSLPQASIVAAKLPRGDSAVGSGPFVLSSIRRAERVIRLAAFDGYYGGRPYLDEVVLRWFDTPDGEARRFEIGSSAISLRGATAFAGAQPKFRADFVEAPASVLVFVGFGGGHPEVVGRRELRAALDLALARGGFTTIGSGEQVIPTRSPVPPAAGGPSLQASERSGDVRAASEKLAGVSAGARPLSAATLAAAHLEILIDDSRPDDREVAERVVRALDKIGVSAAITAVTAAVLRDRVDRGSCDLWIGQLAAPVTDAATWWQLAMTSTSRRSNGKRPADPASRFEKELPIVPLFFRGLRAWYRNDVRGVTFDSSGRLSFADLFLFGDPARAKRASP
jgi:peptide/nickel transport system substrate-binding protein